MRKLIFSIILFLASGVSSFAQYGNEWIDHDKTYYKFKVAADGIYRIPQSALLDAGISQSEIVGADFQLFYLGEEQAIHVSNTGKFASDDFIEFFGKRNDGKPDTELFIRPSDQAHTDYSLFTDSSTYFLTLNPNVQNKRLDNIANDLTNAPPPEPFYLHTEKVTAINRLNSGVPTYLPLPTLFDSRYMEGESWASNPYEDSINIVVPVSNISTQGPQTFVLKTTHHSLSAGQFSLRTRIGNFKKNNPYSNYGITEISETISMNNLTEGNNTVSVIPSLVGVRNVHFQTSITYPREFNFNQKRIASFDVNKVQDLVLELKNFDWQAQHGILYDINNNIRIEVNSPAVASTHFRLPQRTNPSSIFLTNTSTNQVRMINSLNPIVFRDFTDISNQGDYIFLTHKKLTLPLNGIDYTEKYDEHRSSVDGGGYEVVKVFIDEIENQFGYGINTHPIAVRNFVNFALDNWDIQPEYLSICGKGLPNTATRRSTVNNAINLISPYGSPPSDNLLTARNAESSDPQLAVGRISVKDNAELKLYYDKMITYERLQNDTTLTSQSLKSKSWMKRVLHLGGGNTSNEQSLFALFLDRYKRTIEGPKYGGKVTSIFKSSSDPIQIAQSVLMDSLITNGVSLITFFGHSSVNTLDFNLKPENFNNKERYYTMLSNGCLVGSIFEIGRSFSERFVITENRGAIAYIAPINFAVTSSLNRYSTEFYNNLSDRFYNKPLGKTTQQASSHLANLNLPLDEMLAQQMIFHGDPGINVNGHAKPDYVIEAKNITCSPDIVSASIDTFELIIKCTNIGRAVNEDFILSVERTFPNGDFETYSEIVPAPHNDRTYRINILTDRIRGLGENTFVIKVDHNDDINEISEANNEVILKKIILAEDLIPISPPNFCIVNQSPQLIFSTANALDNEKTYLLEIDTTEHFNSPLYEQQEIVSEGGVIKWSPSTIPFIDGVVYYFRSSLKPEMGNPAKYSNSSFLYDRNLGSGWNQSHYFQFIKDKFQTLEISDKRKWKFADDLRTVVLTTGIWNTAIHKNDITLFVDNFLVARNSYISNGFLFWVYDLSTGQALQSSPSPGTCNGTFGDYNCFRGGPIEILAFWAADSESRKKITRFIYNDIPQGSIVMCYSLQRSTFPQFWDDWDLDDNDTTLYDAFEYLGAQNIRNVSGLSPYVFFTEFGNPLAESIEIIGTETGVIDTTLVFAGLWDRGTIRSTKIGPAKDWKSLDIDWEAQENPSVDLSSFNLYGVPKNGGFELLYQSTLDISNRDISEIDAKEFPELYLEMFTQDQGLSTPSKINHWRVFYDKIPEAALNQKIEYFISNDTIKRGEDITIRIAAENISAINMDSMLVKFTITDGRNNSFIQYKRYAALPANEHIIIENSFSFDGFNSEGNNVIVIEMNPDKDQVEQFHFNNFAIIPINVAIDNENPLLDVTFDGEHILDGDIVSPHPEILISLTDENQFLALDDSNAIELFIIYPNDKDNPRLIETNDEQVEFIPANTDNLERNNEARLYYRPTFEEDGIYELRVQGIDKSNNEAGKYDYRIKFEVINKPSITNFVNYPNPFSTSTRFVFTLTGSEVPEDILIKIYTISGRVVREIKANELGPLKIGNNITEFAWDGKDEFGDQLANGVYLYSVQVKLNGQAIDHREASMDQFFKKSMGKMYLMR